jgi:hypothetical protein
VSLAVLLIAIATTAVVVSGFFLWQRHSSSLGKDTSRATPIAQKPPNEDKPSATPMIASPPRVAAMTDEDLFKIATPSVVLLRVFDQSGQPIKLGSGFVAAANGVVITNYHMIRGAYSEAATFQDGSTTGVLGVLGFDPVADVAVIRVGTASVRPLALGDSDSVQVGERVAAIGSPLGLQNTISDGLVSALRNGRIQTSTPISPGSSGGPFFNQNGEVIGVAVATVRGGQNLNFVVPIDQAKPYLTNTSLTTLADIAKQNTVTLPLFPDAVNIPARQFRRLPIIVDENRMDDAELQGSFQCSGGIDGRIQVVVLDDTAHPIYDSGRVVSGTIDLKLRAGQYNLVLSNIESLVFPRTVTADISLRYVK